VITTQFLRSSMALVSFLRDVALHSSGLVFLIAPFQPPQDWTDHVRDGEGPLPEHAVDARRTVLDGRVLMPGGGPAPGALVVSGAGGQAVADAEGDFLLDVDVPDDTTELQVTAARAGQGSTLLASARIPIHPAGARTRTGILELGTGTGCNPSWLPTFGGAPGVNGRVLAFTVFDDGDGPALYAGGLFWRAGGASVNYIAKWDGTYWSALGSGMSSDGYAAVYALTVYDDGTGSGPALYAGGIFTTAGGVPASSIARWDGTSWSALGSGVSNDGDAIVQALTVYDDGTGAGPSLYAGGRFTSAGGVDASYIAKWDGTSWSTVDTGMNHLVNVLAVHDDGTGGGPALYAGGFFTTAGNVPANRIARWNGSSWSRLGSGMNSSVDALTVYDDGTGGGPELYAGGYFNIAGGVLVGRIAKWDGNSWSALADGGVGGGYYPQVLALTVYDDGTGGGPALYAGGEFVVAGNEPAKRIAKWDGASWSPLGSGMNYPVHALTVYEDGGGSGPALYAGGEFTIAGDDPQDRIAKWDGAHWSSLGSGMNDSVGDMTVYDDGMGEGRALYAGGRFTSVGGVPASRIARWDGTSWSTLGSGLNSNPYYPSPFVSALMVYDDGTGGGPALYAGGYFHRAGDVSANYVAKWDGISWSGLGSGIGGEYSYVYALTVYDDGAGAGPALYVGGLFYVAGGAPANYVAKWDGASWSALGSGMNNEVYSLAVYDDGMGGGPALYAGGHFTIAGGVLVSRIAKWDGASWSAVGNGMTGGDVHALAVHDDGTGGGPALYAGGGFTTAGGVPANHIARWDGVSWSGLGSGTGGSAYPFVYALTVYDDGTGGGPALYVGGGFTTAGGVPANRIAKWDGTSWSALGSGVNDGVFALTVFDAGTQAGAALHAGGWFTISPAGDSFIAEWGGCAGPEIGTPYCFGDDSGTPCPCGNSAGRGQGCANSSGVGAVLSAGGTSSEMADDLTFTARNLLVGQPAQLFAGINALNNGDGTVFGDGLRCAGGTVLRLGIRLPDGAGTVRWGPGLGAQGGWVAGDTRRFQVWYGDRTIGPCLSGFNLTNGYEVVFTF